jgi:hypothetical protein
MVIMKKVSILVRLSILAAILVTVFGLTKPVSSNDVITQIVVAPAAATVQTCSDLTIAIRVENVTNLTGYHLEIDYDPSAIQVTDVVNGGFLDGADDAAFYEPTNTIDNVNGTILFGMAQQNSASDPMTPKTGSGDLILITLEAVTWNLSTDIMINSGSSMLVDWPDAFEIPFTVMNGGVTTESCTPTALELSNSDVPENDPAGSLVGMLTTIDPDCWDAFTYSLVDAATYPDNLFFQIDGDRLETAAILDYEAKSSYTVKVRSTDCSGKFIERVFTIYVVDINEAPTAVADTYSVIENETLVVDSPGVLENDVDPENDSLLAYQLSDPPTGEGTVVLNSDGRFSYTPPTDWIGTTSFRYRVFDGEFYSADAVVTIHVNDSNRPPTDIQLDDACLPENAGVNAVVGELSTVDPDPLDSFTYSLVCGVGGADNNLLNIAGDRLRASVDFNYEVRHVYSVRIRSTDQGGLSVEKAFTICIKDENDLPVAYPQVVYTDEEVPVAITLTGSDEDQDDLEFVLVTDPAHGEVPWTPPVVTYTPDDAFFGTDSFEFKVIDEHNASSNPATITIHVVDVNQPPSDINLSNQSVFENEDPDTLVGVLSSVDQDLSDTHTYGLVAGVGDEGNGSFYIDGDQLMTAESFNYEVQDSYSVRIRSTDADGLTFEKVFIIQILDVNDPPVAYSQEVITTEDEPVTFTIAGFDEDGDEIVFNLVTSPRNGDMPWTPPDLTYSPDYGFEGVDFFTFTVTDEHNAVSNTAMVNIVANPKDTVDYFLPIFFYQSK